MNKVAEFYTKAMADENAKKEIIAILGDNKFEEASDERLAKIGDVAKKLGFEISVDDAKAYLNPADGAIDDEDLESVAGGKGDRGNVNCKNGVGSVDINL